MEGCVSLPSGYLFGARPMEGNLYPAFITEVYPSLRNQVTDRKLGDQSIIANAADGQGLWFTYNQVEIKSVLVVI